MFMRNNRAKNGAAQPEKLAASQASDQRSVRKLSPNDYPGDAPDDWRFQAQLGTVAAINDAHYEGGVSGNGPYSPAYEAKIPFVGRDVPSSSDRKLKGQ